MAIVDRDVRKMLRGYRKEWGERVQEGVGWKGSERSGMKGCKKEWGGRGEEEIGVK